jgi:hypothetical protein
MRLKNQFAILLLIALTITACSQNNTAAPPPEATTEPTLAAQEPEIMDVPDDAEVENDDDASEFAIPEFFPWKCDDFSITEGTEIGLFQEWITMTAEQNSEFFAAAEHRVYMNDLLIQPVTAELLGIEEDGLGNFTQLYWMDIGSFPAGTYTLRNVVELTEPVFDGSDWYGPGYEIEKMENTCTVTVLPASAEMADENILVPAENEDFLATCEISSPIRESWYTLLCETFDFSTELWQGTSQGTTARLDAGQYVIDNTIGVSEGYTVGYTFPVDVASASDHMISVDGKIDSNYRDCTWGVFVRSEFGLVDYFFMINNEGIYTLTGSTDNDAARYLGNIASGSHPAIVWDGSNNITAVAEGDQMEFYVNGELVTTHTSINDSASVFGLIVWGGEGVSAINQFDNLLVRIK